MDTLEALKLLIEADVGPEAGKIAMTYFAYQLVSTVLIGGFVILIVILLSRLVVRTTTNDEEHKDNDRQLRRWRDDLGIGCSGILTAQERSLTIHAINSLIASHREKKAAK